MRYGSGSELGYFPTKRSKKICQHFERELGVLTSQCLDRRIPNKQILIDEIAAWEHDRNANLR